MGYAPGAANFLDAWTLFATWAGSMAPTLMPVSSAPTVPPVCFYTDPRNGAGVQVGLWDSTKSHVGGDVVRVGGQRFMCRDHPYNVWCDLESYAPNTDPAGNWINAWVANGECVPPSPTVSPSPTSTPSTAGPTPSPSASPSAEPSSDPSDLPSSLPHWVPSEEPSSAPSRLPSGEPSVSPSDEPSGEPSSTPSDEPSMRPSMEPSIEPSGTPSVEPSDRPSAKPSNAPSKTPSVAP